MPFYARVSFLCDFFWYSSSQCSLKRQISPSVIFADIVTAELHSSTPKTLLMVDIIFLLISGPPKLRIVSKLAEKVSSFLLYGTPRTVVSLLRLLLIKLLEQLQHEAARLVTGAIKGTSCESLLNDTTSPAWAKLKERRSYHKLKMIYKILNNLAPSYLLQLFPVQLRSISVYKHRPHA